MPPPIISRPIGPCYDAATKGEKMIDRRRAIRLALAALPAAWAFRSSPAQAEPAFRRFLPFLIDIDGWEGKEPTGFSMEMPGNFQHSLK